MDNTEQIKRKTSCAWTLKRGEEEIEVVTVGTKATKDIVRYINQGFKIVRKTPIFE